jgi:CYTH domain
MRADQSPELEFKLGAHPEFQLPDPPTALCPPALNEVELTATYWDTPDLRLTRRGMSLRHRSAEDNSERGWTVKLSAPLDDKQLTSRTEVHLPGRAAQPPNAAIRLLRGVTLGASLEAMADIVTTRRQFDLLGDDDQVCARVMDDHVHATPRTGPPLDFREVEVEVVGTDTEMAKRYVRRLRKAGAESPWSGQRSNGC